MADQRPRCCTLHARMGETPMKGNQYNIIGKVVRWEEEEEEERERVMI